MRSLFVFAALAFYALALTATPPVSHPVLAGRWEGTLVREGSRLDAAFEFQRDDQGLAGTFDAPSLRALGIGLSALRFKPPAVHFELVGDTSAIVFDGTVVGDTLTGTFKEGDAAGDFSLHRTEPRPLPYGIEEVRFQNGDVTLAGSLFLPKSPGRHPAVVFLHGSGPEGRQASRFLADHLARRGIAGLTYDKRGVGGSTGDWQREDFQALAKDAIAGLQLLKPRKEIDPEAIGIYGHSQGGLIAPLVATLSPDVHFIIAAAAHGGPAWEQDLHRVRNEIAVEGYSPDEIAHALAYYRLFLDTARTGEGEEAFAAATAKAKSERWYPWLALPPKGHWLWRFYRQTGSYDSLPLWRQIRIPVLLVYGEKDSLIAVDESARRIDLTLHQGGNPDYTIVALPRAAHNLNIEPQVGKAFEWPRLAPGYGDLIASWILFHQGGIIPSGTPR